MDSVPLFVESDSRFCVDITSTKDGKFITVNSNSRTSSEEGAYFTFPLFLSIAFGQTFCLYVLHLGHPGLCHRCS